ncbi:hypothetical protein AB0Y20_01090 [Heyndrickxia oleronia]|uniref:hypothetical protein n=1 Tax=Heyndrickxia oleronia TaxID=38875 RepID=UPI003F28C545
MKKDLISYFYNVRMSEKLNLSVPSGIHNKYGYWSFENYMTFKLGDFDFRIEEDRSLFGTMKVLITVDNITIFNNGWIHSVPDQMKISLKIELKSVKEFNKKCKKNKVSRSYDRLLKQKKLEEKQHQIRKFEDEKRTLIDKFSMK